MRTRPAPFLSSLVLAALAAGCCLMPPEPSGPRIGETSVHALGPGPTGRDRFEIVQRGEAGVPRAEVEAALMQSMSEAARAAGADRFVVLERTTDCVITLRTDAITTCTYRQPDDALFPYFFGEYEVGPEANRPQRAFEAIARMEPGGPAECRQAARCFRVSPADGSP